LERIDGTEKKPNWMAEAIPIKQEGQRKQTKPIKEIFIFKELIR